ncbi:tRNA splicing 2' phosphotransferase [Trichophyton interdigitale]|uniref:2'-phosphotransferase n=1 Tax=Trichophyton interdigitale TaxID=101480 RepID=A0A9P4YLT9_9EURO|nr:tRNA splicing 2' phosphotransferase [Trichophyton interdigitale]KAF3899590.1 tRNA splicing 2' phosphotransferase [Trichophyton interdigitale]KAG8209883.1 tRNA splicing 2' phosphotransferase [Trichophyton interdigitale]
MAPPRGRGGRDQPREYRISRELTFILRHAAEKEGINIDRQGYANVGELLQYRKLKGLKATLSDVLEAVSTSDKQRFGLLYIPGQPTSAEIKAKEEATTGDESSLSTATIQALAANDPDPNNYLIRARQGHSMKCIDAASLLTPLTLSENPPVPLPDTVVHGTYHATWPKILQSGGLRCMGRNHIHFASGPSISTILPNGRDGEVATPSTKGRGQDGVISGMRADAQILIYIDLKRALAAGCPFGISENGVILSEGMSTDGSGDKKIGLEFFDIVVERKNGLGVLWENGELVKESPDWMLNAKAPAGKGGQKGQGGKGKGKAPRLKVERGTDHIDED